MKAPLLIPKRPQMAAPMGAQDISKMIAGAQPQVTEDPLAKYSDLLARLGAGASKKPGQVSIMPVPKKPGQVSIMPVPKKPLVAFMPSNGPGRSWAEIVSEIMKGMK